MTSEKFSLRTIVLALAAITAFTVSAASSASFAQDAPADAPAAQEAAPAPEAAPAEAAPAENAAPAEEPALELPAAAEEPAAEAPAATEEPAAETPAATDSATSEAPAAPSVEQTPTAVVPVESKTNFTGYVTVGAVVVLLVLGWFVGRVLSKQFRLPEFANGYFIIFVCFFGALISTIVGLAQHRVNLGVDLRGGSILVYKVEPVQSDLNQNAAKDELSNEDMSQLKNAIMRRINPSGVREIAIQELGANTEIKITIPEADPAEVARLERVINDTGQLKFRILANYSSTDENEKAVIELANKPERVDIKSDRLADDQIVGDGVVVGYTWLPVDPTQEDCIRQGVVYRNTTFQPRNEEEAAAAPHYDVLVLELQENFVVDGNHIDFVQESVGNMGEPEVLFTMKNEGSKHMQLLTDRYKANPGRDQGRQLGVVFNNRLFSAPNIKSTISDRGSITFGNDLSAESRQRIQGEVRDLIAVMHAGVLPAKLSDKPITEQITGPTLGADTIRKGKNAILWSGIIVLVFMIIYYGFGGCVATFAVIMNLVLIMMAMIGMHAAFTLPGLAGLVLTVGMAVDANVLIFERIREELAGGATVRMAVRNGYQRAFTAIFDSNITTMLTAWILYLVGSEQIKSFAVTLFLGVLFSMFTATYVCRIIFQTCEKLGIVGSKCVSPLIPGMKQLGRPNWDYFKLFKKTVWVSVIIIVVGIASVFVRGKGIFDVDFVGGIEIQLVFNEPVDIGDLRTSLKEDLPDLSVSSLSLGKDQEGNKVADNTCYSISASCPVDMEAVDFQAKVEKLLEEKFAGKLRHYSMDYSVGEPQDVTTAGSDAVKRQTVVSVSVNPPLAEEVVNGYFSDVADKENPLEFTVTREGYEEGSDEAANDWDVVFNSEDTAAIEALAKKAQEIANSQTAFEASNIVGSSVAGYARTQGILAILGSLLCVIAYLWLRFKRAVYGLSAVVGVTHDVLVVLGLIGVSYFVAGALAFLGVTQFKIGLATVAAFLTLIGYSLNDTIVLFDRMREVRGKSEALTKEIINKSVNQCLSRTVLTSLTTLFSALVLYCFGGAGIHTFAFAMLVGVIVGTYSSVFICSPFLYWLLSKRQTKTPSQRVADVSKK